MSEDFESREKVRVRLGRGLAVGLALVTVILAGLGIWRITGDGEDGSGTLPTQAESEQSDPSAGLEFEGAEMGRGYGLADKIEGPTMLILHVVGAVVDPGIVELEAGARVVDAIDAAGGLAQDADVSALNLAAFVSDGSQVSVPRVGEVVVGGTSGVVGAETAGAGGGCIDLNTATESELENLDGVGPKLAARIAQWRAEAGPVSSAQDLLEVPGIGNVLVERIAAGTCQ